MDTLIPPRAAIFFIMRFGDRVPKWRWGLSRETARPSANCRPPSYRANLVSTNVSSCSSAAASPAPPGQWDRSLAGQSGSAAPSRSPVGSRPAALPGSATSSKSLAAEPATGGIVAGSSVGTRRGAGSGSVKRLGARPLHARTNGVSVPKCPTHFRMSTRICRGSCSRKPA